MSGVKQALRLKLLLQLLKGHRQIARAVGLHMRNIELVLPASGKQAYPARQDHLHAALRPEAQAHGVGAEQDAGDYRALILQGEIMMAGGMDLVIGKLAPDAGLRKDLIPVQQQLDIAGQLRDRNRLQCHMRHSMAARMAAPTPLSPPSPCAANQRSFCPRRPSCTREQTETPPETSTGRPGCSLCA